MNLRLLVFFLVNSLSATLGFLATAAAPAPHSVTLAWNSSPTTTVAGYRLYVGTTSRDYTNIVDTGNATIATVPNLTAGVTYFFAVTAYDQIGLESELSSEVRYTVPSSARLGLNVTSATGVRLTGSAPSGYQYEVLQTDDLKTWTAIGNITADTAGTFQFTDALSTNRGWRCYRLRQTSP
jgi:fibronectin type 3 domain-containing protein